MNEGKIFELAFKNSVPKDVFYHRLPDPVESFAEIKDSLKFTLKNPCDLFLYNPQSKKMYALELKSTKKTSITYWDERFEDKSKKQIFTVRKNQVQGLDKISTFNIVSGFLYNFRFTNHTYFQDISDFKNMVNTLDKKSFNEADVVKNKGILVEQKLMRKNYKYDIEGLLNKI